MKSYIKDFIVASVNDVTVSEDILIDYVAPMVDDNIGNVTEQRLDFIKSLLTITDPEHISRIVVNVIDGQVDDFADIVGINIVNHADIDESREKWESTEFAPDFEEILEDMVTSLPTDVDDINTSAEYKF